MYGETKQRRMTRLIGVGAMAVAAIALTGCAHNDVLVFGTSTTIGLNVESVSAQGAPSIVLGYEREEAVWMPLVLNGQDSKLSLCAGDGRGQCATGSVPVSQAMYRSEIIDPNGRVTHDTYSVFASLGARFSGNAGRDGVGAGGGLAQFFATGNAAVSVARNEALVTALKVESAEGAAAQANAVEAASLSAEQRETLEGRRLARGTQLAKIQACAASAAISWTALVNAAGYANDEVLLEGVGDNGELSAADIADRLEGNTNAINRLAAKAAELCPSGG